MNYIQWAAEYEKQNEKIKQSIEREKKLLKAAVGKDEPQTIGKRIAVLRSMLKENEMVAEFLRARGKKYGDHISQSNFNIHAKQEETTYGKNLSA